MGAIQLEALSGWFREEKVFGFEFKLLSNDYYLLDA